MGKSELEVRWLKSEIRGSRMGGKEEGGSELRGGKVGESKVRESGVEENKLGGKKVGESEVEGSEMGKSEMGESKVGVRWELISLLTTSGVYETFSCVSMYPSSICTLSPPNLQYITPLFCPPFLLVLISYGRICRGYWCCETEFSGSE